MGRASAGAVYEEEGLLAVSTGIPVAWLNILFVTRPLRLPEQQLQRAFAFFAERGADYVVRIRDGLDPRTELALEAMGLPYSDTVPGMASTNLDAPRSPSEMRIATVVDDAMLGDFCAVAAAGYGFPEDISRSLFAPQFLREAEVESYVGYVESVPVATSTLVFGGKVAGVHNVATHPDFRRRGYGEALTWRAIERGASAGCDLAALQSSEMGQPIYERMGFRVVSGYKTFHRPGI